MLLLAWEIHSAEKDWDFNIQAVLHEMQPTAVEGTA